jgi:hypothetical protein
LQVRVGGTRRPRRDRSAKVLRARGRPALRAGHGQLAEHLAVPLDCSRDLVISHEFLVGEASGPRHRGHAAGAATFAPCALLPDADSFVQSSIFRAPDRWSPSTSRARSAAHPPFSRSWSTSVEQDLAVPCRLAALSREDEPADARGYPSFFLDPAVADPVVPRDYHERSSADRRQPLVVEAASGDFRKVRMTRVDDLGVRRGERFAESDVVLVDKEPDRHWALRRQRPLLLLVGNRGPDRLRCQVVALRDLVHRLASVMQLP